MAEPALALAGVGKRYPGFALADVTFDLPRGYVLGLVGPNGAGKTTTLKLVLGLLRRDAGEVRVLGLDPERDGAAARARVGFVHDEPFFYPQLTLAQNRALVARFYPTWDEAKFARLAEAFSLRLAQRFGALSRGTRTRFALAMALSHGAELLVLDEPTTGLDPVFRRELLDVLRSELQDERVAIVFSTHITSDLERIADLVVVLQRGRVAAAASREEIAERWGVVRGGLELLEGDGAGLLRGVRRGEHGFEALTADAAAARRRFGARALVERATLDDLVLLTGGGGERA
jgi:ABC-2 type transport system ATP-binding protein